jgi:predicted dehydrogenase
MGYARDPNYQWRVDKNRSNGVLGDLGSHVIDLARWLVGDIVSVNARLAVCLSHTDPAGNQVSSANDSAHLLIKFANGTLGSIQTTWLAHLGDHMRVSLYGEAGTLEADLQFDSVRNNIFRGARVREEKLQNLTIPKKYLEGMDSADMWSVFTTQSVGPRLFIDSILADRTVFPNFWDGYRNQQIIDAAILSNEVRCSVEIPGA